MDILKMKMTVEDRSNFLRGFLILIRKDNKLDKNEKKMALIIGKYFGFSESFCKKAIEELMGNEFISEEPPVFSSKAVAKFFLDETSNILKQIHRVQKSESDWLKRTAQVNNISFPDLNEISVD